MATSGSTNYSITRNEIVNQALQILGVLGLSQTPSSELSSFAIKRLNTMVKSLMTRGRRIWTTAEGVLFFDYNTAKYTISTASSSARASLETDAQVTELASAAIAGATSITVDSSTGMATSDNIGIVMDSGTVHWTTISNIASNTITIASGLSGAAAADNDVYAFTTRIDKPMELMQVRAVSGFTTSRTDRVLQPLSRAEYFSLPSKNSDGIPTSYFYSPNLTSGDLYLWPTPTDMSYHLKFTFGRMIEDLDGANDNPDFPIEYADLLIYNLAYKMAPAFGKAADPNLILIKDIALSELDSMLMWDDESNHMEVTIDAL